MSVHNNDMERRSNMESALSVLLSLFTGHPKFWV
jgi:hypothetical protein